MPARSSRRTASPVLPDDTAETLAARVLAVEHRIYPLALRRVAEEHELDKQPRREPRATGTAGVTRP